MARAVSRRKMGWIAVAFHAGMILCTCGLWIPFYLAARRKRKTITHYRR